MHQIFHEQEPAGNYERAWVMTSGEVVRERITALATCTAYWDEKRSVLVIDLVCYTDSEDTEDWRPAAKRVFETQRSHSHALRSVIAHADGWAALIQSAMPVGDAHRSDDLVLIREAAMTANALADLASLS